MYGTQGTNDIERDLDIAWESINAISWATLAQDEFSEQMARWFPPLWKVHPFREENTRTVVMLMTFYAEYYGYYFDQALLAASAKYVRDSFVLACIEPRYAEFEHLERILKDAVSSEPIEYTFDLDDEPILKQSEKYSKYRSAKEYKPSPHEYRNDESGSTS